MLTRLFPILACGLLGVLVFAQLPQELFDYLRLSQDSATWRVVRTQASSGGTVHELHLHSQVWRGIPWIHRLLLLEPRNISVPDVLFLYVGGDPYFGEELLGLTVANLSGLRVAILNAVPNQPLFGLREDALIAHTFERYLAEGDPDWPLLFPMVRSVVAAMDALSALAPELFGQKIRGFLLAGASKRGWTTYLVAAADPRVLGIIPIVFDFLNFPAQLVRQEELLGGPSPMLRDYSARGLTALALPSPRAARLAYLMDPYTYRYAYTMPKLVVVGSNDPYWATDATSLYWPGLPDPKLLYVIPNVGHNVVFGEQVLTVIAAFARAVAKDLPLPSLQGTVRFGEEGVELLVTADRPALSARLWLAEGSSPDLDRARWQTQELGGESPSYAARIRKSSGYTGFFLELVFAVEGLTLRASTPIRVLGP